MAKESALSGRVMGWLKVAGFFAQRIESDTTPGIPDIYYLKQGTSGWVELKYAKVLPKRDTTAVFKTMNHSLSDDQANWISLCLRNGGRAWVLAAFERTIWLVPGHLADQFNDMTVTELDKFKVTKDQVLEQLEFGRV